MKSVRGGKRATIKQEVKNWSGYFSIAFEKMDYGRWPFYGFWFGIPAISLGYHKLSTLLVGLMLWIGPYLMGQERPDKHRLNTKAVSSEKRCDLPDVRSMARYGVLTTSVDPQAMPYLDWFNAWLRPMVSIRASGSLQKIGLPQLLPTHEQNPSAFQQEMYVFPSFNGGGNWVGGHFFESRRIIGQLWMGANLGNNNEFTRFQRQTQNQNTILGFEQIVLFQNNMATVRKERNADGCHQYTIDIQVFQEGPMQYKVKSGWLSSENETPSLFSIRLTAVSQKFLKQILTEVMREADFWLSNADWIDTGIPKTYLSRRSFQKGILILDVSGERSKEQLVFEGQRQITESAPMENLTFSWPSKPRFVLPTREIYKLQGAIKMGQTMVDHFSVMDGSWSILYDPLSFKPLQSTITPSHHKGQLSKGKERINRSVHLKGSLYGSIVIWRYLNDQQQVVLGEKYNALSFKAKGITDLEISIIGEDLDHWQGRHRIQIPLKRRKTQNVVIPIAGFIPKDRKVTPKSIVFTIFQQKKIRKRLDIQISDVTWLTLSDSTLQGLEKWPLEPLNEVILPTQTLRQLPINH